MSASTTSNSIIFLDSPLKYPNWIYVIEQKTNDSSGIWSMINPDWKAPPTSPLATQPEHREPDVPVPSQVKAGATTMVDIASVQDRWIWDNLNLVYARALKVYEKQDKAMLDIKEYILKSMSDVYLVYIRHLSTPKEILKALKAEVSMTERARMDEARNSYRLLCTDGPKASNVDRWVDEWISAYKEAKDIELPDVNGTQPQYDFINAVRKFDESFANHQNEGLLDSVADNATVPSIETIWTRFKNKRRTNIIQNKSHLLQPGSFATFQGEDSSPTPPNPSQAPLPNNIPAQKRKCLCGLEHNFKDCIYLIPSNRTQGWIPDKAIQDGIDEKLQKNSNLAKFIRFLSKKAAKKAETAKSGNLEAVSCATSVNIANIDTGIAKLGQIPISDVSGVAVYKAGSMSDAASFNTSSNTIHTDVWYMDCASLRHITNNKEFFTADSPAPPGSSVTGGTGLTSIVAIGTVRLPVEILSGPRFITFKDALYAPGYATNVVCITKMFDAGYIVDLEHYIIRKRDIR
jgi:hypothetical protein